jgi:uncharacterized hydrophobic protein (TIGR00271 family)
MVHLRIVVPPDRADAALARLNASASVINVIHLLDAARKPRGDVIMCDVAREDASVLIAELKQLGIDRDGSIALELIDTAVSDAAVRAERAAAGAVTDAVIWEEVTERTSEESSISGTFLIFMTLAALIASVGIYLDSAILIVGAMVVGPEFGPIAGFCVAVVDRRADLAVRSLAALLVGFPLAIAAVVASSLVFKATSITPDDFTQASHALSRTIANPDFFAAFVAFCAGVAGMLSLTTAKSGALIGVLISVTTIPAAANVGVSAAYGDWDTFGGSLGQLGLNIASLLAAGILTLAVQRALFERRRGKHAARSAAVNGAAGSRAA